VGRQDNTRHFGQVFSCDLAPAAMSSAFDHLLGSIPIYLLNYFCTFVGDTTHLKAVAKLFALAGVGWASTPC
jgi:hypothetical protein